METVGCAEPIFTQGAGEGAEGAPRGLLRDGATVQRLRGLSEDTFHAQVLREVLAALELSSDAAEFRVVRRNMTSRPRAVYTSTAVQIGLLPNAAVPDLVGCLLPQVHHAHSARFLRRWLLNPPSHALADQV